MASGMTGWSFAWTGDAPRENAAGGLRLAGWGLYAVITLLGSWLVLYLGGILTTLGTAEGSERHGASGVRIADDSRFGLSTMYLTRGQTAWWDYDVAVEGDSGLRLVVGKTVPTREFIVKVHHLRADGRGRFEVVAPASGFYNFSYELEPIGALFGGAGPGSTRYKLKWGVD